MDAIMTRFIFLLPLLFIILQQVITSVSAIEERNGDGDVLRLHSMDKVTHVDDHQNNNMNINGEEERIHKVINDDQHVSVDDDDEEKNPKVPSDEQANDHEMNNHSSLKPEEAMFFRIEELHIGKTLTVFFRKGTFSFKEFLPKQIADKIPFSSKQIPKILQILSIPEGSSEAQTIEKTLKRCETKTLEGEIRSCVTSLPSLFDFARRALGSNSIQYFATKYLTGLSAPIQNFTVTKVPKRISVPKLVVCHIISYPYKISMCHSMEKTYGYRIHLLSQENGDEIIEAIGLCHFDTSKFPHHKVAFRVLGIKPGDGNALCHFVQADNIIFVPST